MIEIAISPKLFHAGQETDLAVTLTNPGPGICRNVVFDLDVPGQIVTLAGDGHIETDRLPPGKSVRCLMRIRADETGSWVVSSGNFSYRDRRGNTVHVDDYTDRLTVVPMVRVAASPPRFTVDLVEDELTPGRWSTLQVRLCNVGDTLVRDIDLSMSGQLRLDEAGMRRTLPMLAPGGSIVLPFDVLAHETGSVPVHLELTCRYGQPEQPVHHEWTRKIAVGPDATEIGTATVLYASANPEGTASTAATAEAREIRRELDRSSRYHFEERHAIGPRELSNAVLNLRPRIVHLASHGEDGYLYFERDMGQAHVVSPRGVAGLFGATAEHVECVVIGACHSAALAEQVCEHIDHVIAVSDRLSNNVAIAFSVGFYQALAAGSSIEKAYLLGREQVVLQLGDDYMDQPVHLYRRPVDSPDAG